MSNLKSKISKISSTILDKFPIFLSYLYRWLSVWLVYVTLIAVIVAICFDLSPMPYWSPFVEAIFTYDTTALVSAVLVVWTFSASLIVYFMGKMADRCFGIRFYDAMLVKESEFNLLFKAFVFFVEIALLAIFVTYQFRIAFTVLCALQMLNMGYIFLIVNLGTSRNQVFRHVDDQNKAIFQNLSACSDMQEVRKQFHAQRPKWLLIKILRSINYNNYEEMDWLLDCFSPKLWKILDAKPDAQLIASCEMTLDMIAYGSYDTDSGPQLRSAQRDLFSKIISDNNYPVLVKKGILAALLIRTRSLRSNQFFQDLIDFIPSEQSKEIKGWCYNFLYTLVKFYSYGWKKGLLHQLEWRPMDVDETDQLETFIRCYSGQFLAKAPNAGDGGALKKDGVVSHV